MIRFGSSLVWRTLLSIISSLVLLALFLHLVASAGEEINLARLVDVIKNMMPGWVMLYLALHIAGVFFRAERFRVLLRAASPVIPAYPHLVLVTVVRNMVVDLFPARLGELIYAGMLNRGYKVRLDACISSLSLSIWFDIAILVPLGLVLAFTPLVNSELSPRLLSVAILVLVLAVVGVLVLYPGCKIFAHLLRRWAMRFQSRLLDNIVTFFEQLADAISKTMQLGVFGRCLLLTVGVRACKYLALYALFLAVTLPNFQQLSQAQPWMVLISMIASEAAASLPVPAFMSFGTYEAGGTAALAALGFPVDVSALTLLSIHISTQFVDYIFGGICLVLFFLLVRPIVSSNKKSPIRRWTLVVFIILMLLAVGVAGYQYKKYRKARSLVSPPAGHLLENADQHRQQAANDFDRLNGFVVWSSNRFGNHDILKMTLPEMRITRLTTHPNSEYFPRVSPDGQSVVFARGKKRWVSQRNSKDWDVYLLNVKTGEEKLLQRDANQPTWSQDGAHVFFQYQSGGFMQKNIATGETRLLVQSGSGSLPPGLELQTPSFNSERNELAVTFRGSKRGTMLVTPEASQYIAVDDGCQITWAPDGTFMYWVDHGGRGTNKIYRYNPESGEKTGLLDIQNEYSHEYFPKLSTNGKYMVLAASAGGHEHDVADYELFLWRVGDDWDAVTRLTFHTGNDNWPDVYLTDD